MRKSLAICSLLVAAMLVGCTTQTWKGTDMEPGAGRGAQIPWNVHSGLFEANLAAGGGFLAVPDVDFDSDSSDRDFDFDVYTFRGQGFMGYMINDFWEVGIFGEYAYENWDTDDFDSIDVNGFAVGPRLIWNFSTVSTDVVPYIAVSGGVGWMTYEDLGDWGDYDADRVFGQAGFGIRFFGWEGIAINAEGYYRYVADSIDDTAGGVKVDKDVHGNEGGLLISVSYFF